MASQVVLKSEDELSGMKGWRPGSMGRVSKVHGKKMVEKRRDRILGLDMSRSGSGVNKSW